MKKLALILAAGAMTLPMAAPAMADPPRHAKAWGKRAKEQHRIYDSRGRYYEPRRLSRNDRIWRDGDRYYCRRDNGTTGLVIGAGVGALLGRTIDTRGDRSAGTLLGAIGGGLLGREIDRGDLRCR
ncbi:MAG: glycine zipper 2TM domain-containing protein [Porphyrobacter sp.]|nr:glycine zipper 2TM domain-containing protein [Porphyrobacter sp.]